MRHAVDDTARVKRRRRVIVPREHGAWAMLLVPFVVGPMVGQGFHLPGLLFLVSILAFFCARYPLTLLWKRSRGSNGTEGRAELVRWAAGYLGAGIVAGLPLILYYWRLLLAPLAVLFGLLMLVQLYLGTRRLDRTAEGELFAIAALSIAAPAAYYVSGAPLDSAAVSLWLVTFLYSASSVFYVKMKLRQRAPASAAWSLNQRLRVGLGPIVYQALLAVVIAAASILGWVPWLSFLAFVPLMIKVADGILRPRVRESLRRVGFIEVGYAFLFTIIVISAYSL